MSLIREIKFNNGKSTLKVISMPFDRDVDRIMTELINTLLKKKKKIYHATSMSTAKSAES